MAICHADTVLNVLETGKPYPLKFAWIHSTNLYACGTSVPQRWFEAMKKLDFIVASDLFMTPTIMGLADVFVPVATFPEHDGIVQPHFGRCTHFLGAMNKAVEYGETKSDLEICFDLGKRITPEAWPWDSVTEFYSWMLEDFVGFDFDELRAKDAYQAPYEYHKYEKGLCRSDGKPGFETVTGLVELKSLQFGAWGDDPLPYYIEPQYSPLSTPDTYKEYPLVLSTGGRKFTSFHSEHRQIESLRNIDPWPIVEIHPETAAKYGIEDGGWVEIENQFGHCREKARVTPTVDPRVVHAQHGWWFPEQDGEAPNYFGVFKAQINNLMPHEHMGKTRIGRALQMPAVQNPSRQRTRRLGGRTMADALLIDHEYCTGCRSCEIACRNAHEDTIGSQQWGIHVHEEGPWKLSDNKWEWEYLPFPTHLCDLCAERVKEGRKPACVHHCLALCMEYGTVEEMAKRAEELGRNAVLFVPRVQGA